MGAVNLGGTNWSPAAAWVAVGAWCVAVGGSLIIVSRAGVGERLAGSAIDAVARAFSPNVGVSTTVGVLVDVGVGV